MASHYLFEAEFCNPASGWEKGQVEKNVQDARHRLWQPMPRFAAHFHHTYPKLRAGFILRNSTLLDKRTIPLFYYLSDYMSSSRLNVFGCRPGGRRRFPPRRPGWSNHPLQSPIGDSKTIPGFCRGCTRLS
ncbi:hypothetical protein BQ8482_300034 [Mesorhizobium delmotii]|uniref:Transposase n=1 Tax=Mesorhizobium delmotii TaxID=1631247 RepID=A0A2P9ANE8_9HYPH|nr:hypothetical protein BQ8482_300034 [Mesorhizobium delmotii]